MSRRKDGEPIKRQLIGSVHELAHGTSKKFMLRAGGRDVQALLVNYGGEFFAFTNRCPHVGITLDWVDNQFFSVDQRYLMCANHGAVFEPNTGECIWGPCVGLSLQSIALEIKGKRIFVRDADSPIESSNSVKTIREES
jgi:nitrite reductase/ring-hydroxylating ferredoxin subunit